MSTLVTRRSALKTLAGTAAVAGAAGVDPTALVAAEAAAEGTLRMCDERAGRIPENPGLHCEHLLTRL